MTADKRSPLVPKLRFAEFRDAGDWMTKILDNQGGFLSSLTGKTAMDFDTGDATFIPYMNVFSNTFTNISDLRSVNVGSDESQNAVAKGDVFFTISSEIPEEAGISSVLLDEIENCYLNSFCALFRFGDGKSPNPVFLGYLLRSALARAHLSRGAQGATRYNISKTTFRSLPLQLPSGSEQQKVADCLGSLDDLIAAEGRKLEALRQHKQGLMQQLLPQPGETVPRLRFPDFQNAGAWEEEKLDDLARRGTGHTPTKAIAEYYNGGIKWVSLADSMRLDNGLISETEIEISKEGINNSSAVLHPAGSVILSRDAGVGKSAIISCSMAVSQHFIVWTCEPIVLSNWFLYYQLQLLKPLFERIATGSTIKTIGLPFFKAMRVTIPRLAEQHRIADCLSMLDVRLAAQLRKLNALKTHKQGLQQQLFPSLDGQ